MLDEIRLKKELTEFEIKYSSLGEKVKFVINNANIHPSDWNSKLLREFLLHKKWIESDVNDMDVVYEANLLFNFLKCNNALPKVLPYEYRKRKV